MSRKKDGYYHGHTPGKITYLSENKCVLAIERANYILNHFSHSEKYEATGYSHKYTEQDRVATPSDPDIPESEWIQGLLEDLDTITEECGINMNWERHRLKRITDKQRTISVRELADLHRKLISKVQTEYILPKII